jgi:YhcH/YjgK/YiaL family protein
MIFTNIKTADTLSYPEAIRKAIDFVKTHDIEQMELGDHPIEGDKIYAKVFDLTTLPVEETHPEIHYKYIDVQFWPNGSERFGIAPYYGGGTIVEAREAADTYFLESVEDESFVTARPGSIAVFYPWDAHRPGTVLGEQATFRKCVVKVALDQI